MLELTGVDAYYGKVHVLRGVSIEVGGGMITSIRGANGAGKTTLLKTISGVVRPTTGKITFRGQEVNGMAPEKIVALGIGQVPEGRQIFGPLSVLSNLRLGAYARYKKEPKEAIEEDLRHVQEIFPILKDRLHRTAGTLSGGEQQMLAIGRTLMGKPKLLLLDEPSVGLAPLVVAEIFRVINNLREQGTTVLLVEQNARLALEISDHAYLLKNGQVVEGGTADLLRESDGVRDAYLGGS